MCLSTPLPGNCSQFQHNLTVSQKSLKHDMSSMQTDSQREKE